jgi:hypothetical protein
MSVIIFNWLGLAFCAVGFGIAFAIGYMLGITEEGFLMVIAGPITSAIDIVYRIKSKNGHWLNPNRGGSLFFLPVWCFGLLWLIFGIIYMIKGTT